MLKIDRRMYIITTIGISSTWGTEGDFRCGTKTLTNGTAGVYMLL